MPDLDGPDRDPAQIDHEREKALLAAAARHMVDGSTTTEPDGAVFWSGGVEVKENGEPHFRNAEEAHRFVAERNAEIGAGGRPGPDRPVRYDTIRTLPIAQTFLPLWHDETLSREVRRKLGDMYSSGFATNAKGQVTVFGEDTDFRSYFRRTEMQDILDNPHVTRIARARYTGDDLKVDPLDKLSWRRAMEEQWFDGAADRLQRADIQYKSGKLSANRFRRVVNDMEKEVTLAAMRYLESSRALRRRPDEQAEKDRASAHTRFQKAEALAASIPYLHEKMEAGVHAQARKAIGKTTAPADIKSGEIQWTHLKAAASAALDDVPATTRGPVMERASRAPRP